MASARSVQDFTPKFAHMYSFLLVPEPSGFSFLATLVSGKN